MAKVSVVIPCYNAEGTVEEAIKSVIGQTYPVTEIICVDDGSTDTTLAVLYNIADRYPESVKVLSIRNGGAPFARNYGMSKASGEWIQFLDADDVLLPDKIASQISTLHNYGKKADLIIGALYKKEYTVTDSPGVLVEPSDKSVWYDLVKHRMGRTSSNLFRKVFVEEVGGWDESLPCSQEYELMFRIVKRGGLVLRDPRPLTLKRNRPGSVGKSDAAFNVSLGLRKEIMNHARVSGLPDAEEVELWNHLFHWIRSHYRSEQEEALAMFEHVMPASFKPDPHVSGMSKSYCWLFSWFGFKKTEHLYRMVRQLRRMVYSKR